MTRIRLDRLRNPHLLLILGMWALSSLFDLDKAYHIDDAFHLEAARHIREHPLSPMSGAINWHDDPSPMFLYNQPPLFFCVMAGWSVVAGWSEPAMHLLMSLFLLVALLSFDRLLGHFQVRNRSALFLLFASYPGVIASRNVMVDIPLLACLLASLALLFQADRSRALPDELGWALLLSCGLLIKYSLLPLIPVIAVHLWLRGGARRVLWVLVPILVLGLWSWWNMIEFGSVHLLGRPLASAQEHRLLGLIACLGATTGFGLALVGGILPKRMAMVPALLSGGTLLVTGMLVFKEGITETVHLSVLNTVFLASGTAVLVPVVLVQKRQLSRSPGVFLASDDGLLLLSTGVMILFLAMLAPFVAVRHVLLVLPLLLLLGRGLFQQAPRVLRNGVVVASCLLGLLLAVSDKAYANNYRTMAGQVVEAGRTTHAIGHWGWQWYMRQLGAPTYATGRLDVRTGDALAGPKDVPRQRIHPALELELKCRHWVPPSWRTFVSVSDFSGLYFSSWQKPVWRFSSRPTDTVEVFLVTRGFDEGTVRVPIGQDSARSSLIGEKAIELGIPVDTVLHRDAR